MIRLVLGAFLIVFAVLVACGLAVLGLLAVMLGITGLRRLAARWRMPRHVRRVTGMTAEQVGAELAGIEKATQDAATRRDG